MTGWADERLMVVYDTINDIARFRHKGSVSYALCREMLDHIERLDDAITEEAHD